MPTFTYEFFVSEFLTNPKLLKFNSLRAVKHNCIDLGEEWHLKLKKIAVTDFTSAPF